MSFRSILDLLGIAMLVLPASLALAGDPIPPEESLEGAYPTIDTFSPYAGRDFPNRPFWGDTHVHTALSMDAGAFGARLSYSGAELRTVPCLRQADAPLTEQADLQAWTHL